MKPQLLKVSTGPAQSFSVRQDLVPYINNHWHYHPEVELIHFNKGKGTQFVGDSIKRFQTGDVVLIGAQLPHFWRFDDNYFAHDSTCQADVRVAHFNENFWGDQFLNLPENKTIKAVLEKAKRGIKVNGSCKKTISVLLEKMLQAEGSERIVILIQALTELANSNQITILSSIGFRHDFEEAEKDRINDIYNYTLSNFKRKINLEEIAAVAKVSPNSFCRYFKSRTRKTFTQFLIEIKVGHACKLLIENKLSIKQLCYESGFNNFASFHKYFKIITGKSPLMYQKDFLNNKKEL
ncbi:helix-turn-helix transcriptional regulator [Pedobacter sp. BS3]|uniref:AraC family transcriptional regulator n=1 Tax=Pedobacter sp. BS3 TaxID=2567937 RepID=UPI0011EFEE78|nr:helix-turn-helix domain-containing protein [Pedobacter sp. BS3]TZF84933.1 helix-turn-helix transcriptional regulator [Pedobacter sp. BS3]